MIKVEKVNEAFEEAFIDFEVGYEYKIKIESGVIETNKTGTIKQCKKASHRCLCPNHIYMEGKPVDLYPDMSSLYNSGSTGSYREVIVITYYFESNKTYPVTKNTGMLHEYWQKSQFENEFIKEDLIAFKEDFDYGIQKVNILLGREKISFLNNFKNGNFIFKIRKPSTVDEFPILFRGSHCIYGDEFEFVVDITSKLKERI